MDNENARRYTSGVQSPLDPFIPHPDSRESHSVLVRAPAPLVYEVARSYDAESIFLVRVIFVLREKIMGSRASRRIGRGFIDEVTTLGWGCLVERPGEIYIAGAVCQPWLPDVIFRPVQPGDFASFSHPGEVKIAWSLETRARGSALTELATETRAVATDDESRRRFLAYWHWARFGIFPIRWLLLYAIRRQAESDWRRHPSFHTGL